MSDSLIPGDLIVFIEERVRREEPTLMYTITRNLFKSGVFGVIVSVVNRVLDSNCSVQFTHVVSSGGIGWVRTDGPAAASIELISRV